MDVYSATKFYFFPGRNNVSPKKICQKIQFWQWLHPKFWVKSKFWGNWGIILKILGTFLLILGIFRQIRVILKKCRGFLLILGQIYAISDIFQIVSPKSRISFPPPYQYFPEYTSMHCTEKHLTLQYPYPDRILSFSSQIFLTVSG